MTLLTNDISQQKAAKITAISLLVLIISGICGNFIFSAGIIVDGDPVKTAQHLIDSSLRFRLSIVCILFMFNCDIIEAIALYALLKTVNKSLALLSTFWRFANACIGASLLFSGFFTMKLAGISGYPVGLNQVQSHSLMMIFVSTESDLSLIGLLFFSFGMVVTGYLFYMSKYVPRILSGFYFVAAILLLIGTLTLLIWPDSGSLVNPAFIIPDFLAELSLALWLLIKGVKLPRHEI
jgi:hypothetical protein